MNPTRPFHSRYGCVLTLAAVCVQSLTVLADANTEAVPPPSAVGSTNAPMLAVVRTNGVAKLDFDSFKLIKERNIFNPNRTARSARSGTDAEKPKTPKVEYANLVGIMSYSKGDFAFFDGSSGDYRKTVQRDEKIAGHRVIAIGPEKVTLSIDGKTVSLPVSGQIKKVDEGAWEVVAGSDKVVTASSGGAGSSSSGGDSASGGGEDDVLKRLLKKREQESKNEK